MLIKSLALIIHFILSAAATHFCYVDPTQKVGRIEVIPAQSICGSLAVKSSGFVFITEAEPNYKRHDSMIEGVSVFSINANGNKYSSLVAWRAHSYLDVNIIVIPQPANNEIREVCCSDYSYVSGRDAAIIFEIDDGFREKVRTYHAAELVFLGRNPFAINYFDAINKQIWPQIGLARALRNSIRLSRFRGSVDRGSSTSPRFVSGVLCEPSCRSSGGQGQKSYDTADYPEQKGKIGAALGGVRSLPLSAKIGLTIFGTLGAFGCFTLGFIRLIERIGNPAKGIAYFTLGFVFFGIGLLPAWWSGT